MALRYCFEQSYVARTLASSKPHDLAVVDTEGSEKAVREAVNRGAHVRKYLNKLKTECSKLQIHSSN